MTDLHYIAQVILCLAIVVCTPLSLTKRRLSRRWRTLLAFFLTLYGVAYHLIFAEVGGIVAGLIGLWALFFITIHPRQADGEPRGEKEEDGRE